MRTSVKDSLWGATGVLILILGWFWATRDQLDYVFPSPQATWVAFVDLMVSGAIPDAVLISLYRTVLGLTLGVLAGFILGLIMGIIPLADKLTRWIVTVFTAIPPIIVVVMAQVWFGATSTTVVVTVMIVVLPMLTIATRDAITQIDPNLQEMATVFGMDQQARIWHITIPSILPPVLSTAVIALGQSVRLAVMGELLVTTSGLGAQVRLAQINIDTPSVFALGIVISLIAFVLELVCIAPVRKRREAMMRGDAPVI